MFVNYMCVEFMLNNGYIFVKLLGNSFLIDFFFSFFCIVQSILILTMKTEESFISKYILKVIQINIIFKQLCGGGGQFCIFSSSNIIIPSSPSFSFFFLKKNCKTKYLVCVLFYRRIDHLRFYYFFKKNHILNFEF